LLWDIAALGLITVVAVGAFAFMNRQRKIALF
jgi:hypothetical protein